MHVLIIITLFLLFKIIVLRLIVLKRTIVYSKYSNTGKHQKKTNNIKITENSILLARLKALHEIICQNCQ